MSQGSWSSEDTSAVASGTDDGVSSTLKRGLQEWFDGVDFFLLEAAWVKSRAERPSVSEVSGQLHVQFGCKLTSKLAKERIKQKQQTNYKFRIPN